MFGEFFLKCLVASTYILEIKTILFVTKNGTTFQDLSTSPLGSNTIQILSIYFFVFSTQGIVTISLQAALKL